MAEGEGFEPPDPCGSTVFKTVALSQTLPPLRGEEDSTGERVCVAARTRDAYGCSSSQFPMSSLAFS